MKKIRKQSANGKALPNRQRRSPRDIPLVYGPAIVVTLIGFIVAYQFVEPAPPRRITMAAGSPDGAYYRFAKRYQQILEGEGIELELVETAGTLDNLRLLAQPDGPVDLALLQGDAAVQLSSDGVESLASLFYEPFWLFFRGAAPDRASTLAGKRIAGGVAGSGTRHATDFLLAANGLEPNEVNLVPLGGDAAADALTTGEIDVATFVAAYEAPYVQKLLLAEGIDLMPFGRGETYERQYAFISRVVLPRGFASLAQDLPAADVPLIAFVANLAARDTLHPALIPLILGAAEQVHKSGDPFAGHGEFPSAQYTAFPMSQSAERYLRKGPPFLQRFLPFWVAAAIDRLSVLLIPLVTLLYPLVKILPPVYRWRIRLRIFRYYRSLLEIETQVHQEPSRQELEGCRSRLTTIEDELNQVSVPVLYADALYNMRLHLKLVREKLEEKAIAIAASEG